jgi:hypothetical protein
LPWLTASIIGQVKAVIVAAGAGIIAKTEEQDWLRLPKKPGNLSLSG